MQNKRVCYKEQMRTADRNATEIGGIPSILLMEHAAASVVQELPLDTGRESFAVFCGKGNNAGDGFAIARLLLQRGEKTDVYLVCGDGFSGDCRTNYEILVRMNAHIVPLEEKEEIDMIVQSHSCIIDAIYGTGVHGTVNGLAADAIASINTYGRQVISVDVPSGMNSNTGEICGICVKAKKTVTFAAYKAGMFLYPAADYTGEVVLRDIGIPSNILENADHSLLDMTVIDEERVRKLLPIRKQNSHKGDYGKVLIIGGSIGMTGAPCLAAKAALTTGCGIVTAAAPETLHPIYEVKLTEEMTIPVSERDGHFAQEAAEQLAETANDYDAVLFGPGVGRSDDIVKILEYLTTHVSVPMVIDADGLYALAQHMDLLNNRSCNMILTPHDGEMARLAGRPIAEKEKFEFCRCFAQTYGVTLVLKGHYTVVTGADGKQYISNAGNSGMATAGSGDVLGGMIVSMLAQGKEPLSAAAVGVYLHGTAGDIAAYHNTEDCVTASLIIDMLPRTIGFCRNEREILPLDLF